MSRKKDLKKQEIKYPEDFIDKFIAGNSGSRRSTLAAST